jgi:anti-sigma B factor antagonist
MEVKTKRAGNVIIIYFTGKLDVHASADYESEINKLINQEPDCHMLFNLDQVEYMSSSGLRIFVSTMRMLKESNRKLKLCNMNNAVKRIFEVVELMDMFEIYETEEEALKHFN